MSRKFKLILRLCWVPVAAVFLFAFLSNATRSLNNIAYALTHGDLDLFLRFDTREQVVFILFASFVTLHLVLEFLTYSSPKLRLPKTMSHLRYGPAAVMSVFVVAVIVFDATMIELSRYRIKSYVYNGSSVVTEPDLDLLHNNDRGWCGNGLAATYENLYYPTASAGLDDPDPAVRARAFLAAADVRDFLNGSPRFTAHTDLACGDESEVVRSTVERYLAGRKSSCHEKLQLEGKRPFSR